MHFCCNVVCGPEGDAERRPAARRRGGRRDSTSPGRAALGAADRDLARGPARLCRALGIDLDATRRRPGRRAGHADARRRRSRDVSTGPRVGLRAAADRPWRFWLTGEPSVSAYRPRDARRCQRRRPTRFGASWQAAANVLLVALSGSPPGRKAN